MKALWLAALLAVSLSGCTGSSKKNIPSTASTSTAPSSTALSPPPATPEVLPSAQASAIKAALDSGSPQKIDAVLDPAVRAAYVKSPERLLPAEATIMIDSKSMKVSGNRAQVGATVTSSGKTTDWTLLMSKTGDKWLIYGTTR